MNTFSDEEISLLMTDPLVESIKFLNVDFTTLHNKKEYDIK